MKLLLILSLVLLTSCSRDVEESEVVEKTSEEVDLSEDLDQLEESEESEETEPSYQGEYSKLDGRPVEDNESRTYGVMIDNHYDARPQYGLSQAQTVYEYEVESEITRYLAIFGGQEVGKIGPIRSARPYFIDTIREYDGFYVRFGGSSQADEELKALDYPQLNGMASAGEIWRDSEDGKFAPHNAFSSSEAILDKMDRAGWQTGETVGVFSFNKEDLDLEDPDGRLDEIYLPFNEVDPVSFVYQDKDKTYQRLVAGQVQVDAGNDEEIRAKNILVLFMEMGYMEDGIHRWMGNLTRGRGLYITDGSYKTINWQKDDRGSKTKIFYEDGEEVLLNPGQTWVEVFDINKDYTIE